MLSLGYSEEELERIHKCVGPGSTGDQILYAGPLVWNLLHVTKLLEKTPGSIIQTADGCVRLMENYDQPVNITILCHLESKHQLVLLS